MKKIISAVLAATMLITAAITANAASVDENAVGASKYTVKDTITINDGQIRFYKYNYTDDNPQTGICLEDSAANVSKDFYFNNFKGYNQINVSKTSFLKSYLVMEGDYVGPQYKKYDKTGGTYEKIRIKLSDYSDYFNSDGTFTRNGFDYNFSTQHKGDYIYKSALVFSSGGIFTAVTPDKDGYAEFYVSKNIGENTSFSTSYSYENPVEHSMGIGYGKSGENLNYFTMGDINVDGAINVDDVTAIQLYAAGLKKLYNLQQRNADVTADGKIDINDVTMIQKYLAGYDV